jgi:hypothetical protein
MVAKVKAVYLWQCYLSISAPVILNPDFGPTKKMKMATVNLALCVGQLKIYEAWQYMRDLLDCYQNQCFSSVFNKSIARELYSSLKREASDNR